MRHSAKVYFDKYSGKWVAELEDFPGVKVRAENLQELIKITRAALATKLGLIDEEAIRADMGLIN